MHDTFDSRILRANGVALEYGNFQRVGIHLSASSHTLTNATGKNWQEDTMWTGKTLVKPVKRRGQVRIPV